MTRRMREIPLSFLIAFSGITYGQTCLITNPAQPFSVESIVRETNSVALTWGPTCTNLCLWHFQHRPISPLIANTKTRAGLWGSFQEPAS